MATLLPSSGCEDEKPPPTPPVETPAPDRPLGKLPQGPKARSLSQALKSLRNTTPTGFHVPDTTEGNAYGQWLTHLGLAASQSRLPSMPPVSGFAGTLVDQGRIWLVSETQGNNRGAGAVALRATSRAPLIVEAPHSFFDSKTLPVALTLFDKGRARALLVNTLHRGGVGSDADRMERVRQGTTEADVAHADSSFFQLSHEALSRSWPEAVVVQLHGFRDEKVPRVQVIVSAAGTTADTAPLARALNDTLGPGSARRYPEEVKQLGGTKNIQARSSRSQGRKFYHLEMSATLRSRLARERKFRGEFCQAIIEGLGLR